MTEMMTQEAPFPTILANLVEKTKYRDGWEFYLMNRDRGQGSKGLTLAIYVTCVDTYQPDKQIRIVHYFIVPAAAYDERSWRRWLFEQILLVERHEAAEFFQIDGKRPYAPNHGPGNDPYIIFEEGTLQEKRTDYLGNQRDTDAP
jgi:hypothetical protein